MFKNAIPRLKNGIQKENSSMMPRLFPLIRCFIYLLLQMLTKHTYVKSKLAPFGLLLSFFAKQQALASVVRIVTRLQDGASGIRFPSYRLCGPHSLLFSDGYVFFPWGKIDGAVKLAIHLHLKPRSSESIFLPPHSPP